MIRVGVAGALGRLGRVACAAIASAPDLDLVAGFGRSHAGAELAALIGVTAAHEARMHDEIGTFFDVPMDVVVDCTVYPISMDIARHAIDRGIAPVVGASGWPDEDLISFGDACDDANIGAMVVPNFAIGAVVLMRFAAEAAKLFPRAEIIEMHHDKKLDAPSGTARATAALMEPAMPHVPIHSVRLPGLIAHQEVIFGATGQTLTIRHDTTSRDSFADGILLAVRNVRAQDGLVVGLDALLFGEVEA